MILGRIVEQRKDIQKAQSHNRDILEREPKLSPAANNLAWLMAEQGGNYDEALSVAEKARAQPSDHPHIADTREWIYFKKNASLKVVPLFQETTEKLPEIRSCSIILEWRNSKMGIG